MNLAQFLRILRARRALVGMVALAAVLAAFALIVVVPWRYEASAALVVEPPQVNPAWSKAAPPASGDALVTTQIDVLRSKAVALAVVHALRLEARPNARSLLASMSPLEAVRNSVLELPWVAALLSKDDEEERVSLRSWMADRLVANLRTRSNRDSRMVEVRYLSPEPEFSAEVANAFTQAYLQFIHQQYVQPAQRNSRWLDEQLAQLRGRMQQAEEKLAAFQRKKGMVATEEHVDAETLRLQELSSRMVEAQSLAYEGRARRRQLDAYVKSGGKAGTAPAEVLASLSVQQRKMELAQLEARAGELSQSAGRNHPARKALEADIARARGALDQEMRQSARSLLASSDAPEQREAALRAAVQEQKDRVLAMKGDHAELALLEREADAARQAYDAASQRQTEARLQGDAAQSNQGAIVAVATPPTRPARPTAVLMLAVALAGGIVAGTGAALYAEAAIPYVRSEADLIESLELPVLAALSDRGGTPRMLQLARPGAPLLGHRKG